MLVTLVHSFKHASVLHSSSQKVQVLEVNNMHLLLAKTWLMCFLLCDASFLDITFETLPSEILCTFKKNLKEKL